MTPKHTILTVAIAWAVAHGGSEALADLAAPEAAVINGWKAAGDSEMSTRRGGNISIENYVVENYADQDGSIFGNYLGDNSSSGDVRISDSFRGVHGVQLNSVVTAPFVVTNMAANVSIILK